MAKKDKLRGFVFYTQDYFGDVPVRLMPLHLRMIWAEAFFLMDQSPRRGVLLKKNGETYTREELAKTMNATIDEVDQAFDWVIREGIASIDGRTKALMNRRMVREENRRRINEKNGRKGGNPSLVKQTTVTPKTGSVNREVIRPDKAKPDPEPEPDPFPLPQHSPSSRLIVPETREGGRTRAPATLTVSLAMESWAREHGITADLEKETAAMLDHYRGLGESRDDWIATWRSWMRKISQFTAKRSNGNGAPEYESKGEQLIRKQREEDKRFDQVMRRRARDGVGPGDPG